MFLSALSVVLSSSAPCVVSSDRQCRPLEDNVPDMLPVDHVIEQMIESETPVRVMMKVLQKMREDGKIIERPSKASHLDNDLSPPPTA